MLDLKRSGGILFILFLENHFSGKFYLIMIILGVLENYDSSFGQTDKMIYNSSEDSCFCLQMSPYFDENVMGFFPPEESINGKFLPLDTIIVKVSNILSERYLYNRVRYELIMCIIVDESGTVRCGIVLKGEKDELAKEALALFKNEIYTPAYYRKKPQNYWFYFFLRKGNADKHKNKSG